MAKVHLGLLAICLLAGSCHAYQVVVKNALVAAMHAVVTCDGKVAIIDRAQANSDEGLRPCRNGESPINCDFKHVKVNGVNAIGSIWDPRTNQVKAVDMMTDTFCSGGLGTADGGVMSVGGTKTGTYSVRYLCKGCNAWKMVGRLQSARWYPSVEMLPDRRFLIVGGQADIGGNMNPTIEYYPKGGDNGVFKSNTLQKGTPNNLYPFTHLLPDGSVFILGNTHACKWYWKTKKEVALPDIPGYGCSYHFAGTSALLPLRADLNWKAEILICGGASAARTTPDTPAATRCGRICVANCGRDAANKWYMGDKLHAPRHMGAAILTPNLQVVFVNGAQKGFSGFAVRGAGFQPADGPALVPDIYRPYSAPGRRFTKGKGTDIPRMYHSSAVLLPNAKIGILGGSANNMWQFGNKIKYRTEMRIEVYEPPYPAYPRPTIATLPGNIKHNGQFVITGKVAGGTGPRDVGVVAINPGLSTHGNNMGMRLVSFKCQWKFGGGGYKATCGTPDANIMPPGCYQVYVTLKGAPSGSKATTIG